MWNDRGVQATFPPVVLAVLVFTSLMTLGSGPRQGGLPPNHSSPIPYPAALLSKASQLRQALNWLPA